MKKIFFKFFVLLLILLPYKVDASSSIVARIDDNYYELLSDAINDAKDDDIITIVSNIILDKIQNINKNITIDLNGFNILGTDIVFKVSNGSFSLIGKGVVKEINPNYAPVFIVGSNNLEDENYSNVYIGTDVLLEGWSGIFIDHNNNVSYGVDVVVDGSINSVLDIGGGKGFGIYINGNIKNDVNYPVITINKTAKINSYGSGIYMAGFSKIILDGGTVEGIDSGVAIKSGVFLMNSGSVIATGSNKTPTLGYNNGINPSGVSIQIESNDNYLGNINITINDGSLRSYNSNVIYEYLSTDTKSTKVSSFNINGGVYTSDALKDNFNLSSSFLNTHNKFINGGKYTSDVSLYLEEGYELIKEEKYYSVIKNTINVLSEIDKNNKFNTVTFTFLITLVLILGVNIYKKYF